MSISISTLIALRRSGRMWMSRYAFRAVLSMVFSRSNSSGAPSRANFLSRRRATLMFLVPSSTESSRLRYSRWSQTFTALRRSEEHTSELQSPCNLVCRLLLEKKNVPQADVGVDELQPQHHLVG